MSIPLARVRAPWWRRAWARVRGRRLEPVPGLVVQVREQVHGTLALVDRLVADLAADGRRVRAQVRELRAQELRRAHERDCAACARAMAWERARGAARRLRAYERGGLLALLAELEVERARIERVLAAMPCAPSAPAEG